MTSGLVLKYVKGLRFVIRERKPVPFHVTIRFFSYDLAASESGILSSRFRTRDLRGTALFMVVRLANRSKLPET